MELVQLITENLGVDQGQAEGGLGLILKHAKEKLAAGDFSKVADLIPGASGLVEKSPESSGGLMGAIGGLTSGLGGAAGNLGSLAGLKRFTLFRARGGC